MLNAVRTSKGGFWTKKWEERLLNDEHGTGNETKFDAKRTFSRVKTASGWNSKSLKRLGRNIGSPEKEQCNLEKHSLEPNFRENGSQTTLGKEGKQQKSDMIICLDNAEGLFNGGDIVKGHVSIVLTQEVKIKDLIVKLVGCSSVHWDDQSLSSFKGGATRPIHRADNEVFLENSITILSKETYHETSKRRASSLALMTETEDGIYLSAGVYNFPFEAPLPKNLPSTFNGRWGKVSYSIKAILERRPWKFDIEREKEFSVKGHVDLNDEPELSRPIGGLGEFRPGCMCFRSGLVTLEIRMGHRGYVPGETVPFYVEIENSSRRKLGNSRIAIIQHVTFKAGRKMRKTSTNVASMEKGEILPFATAVWDNNSISIPPLPPTSNKMHKNIQIKYTMSLFVKYSSWADEYCFSVPVIIGTVAFRKQTIHAYLSSLGYGQTPRSSPSVARRTSQDKDCGQIAGVRSSVSRQSLSAPNAFTPGARHSSVGNMHSMAARKPLTKAQSIRNGDSGNVTPSLSRSAPNSRSSCEPSPKEGVLRCRLKDAKKKSESLDSNDADVIIELDEFETKPH